MTAPSLFDDAPGEQRHALITFLARPRHKATIRHWAKGRGMDADETTDMLDELLEEEAVEQIVTTGEPHYQAVEAPDEDEDDESDADEPLEVAENDEEPTPMPPPVSAPAPPPAATADQRAGLLGYLDRPRQRPEVYAWGRRVGLTEPGTRRLLEGLVESGEVKAHGHPSNPRLLRADLAYTPHPPNVETPPTPPKDETPMKKTEAKPTKLAQSFGPALAEAIVASKMPRTDVASNVGVSPSMIGQWIAEKHPPREAVYEKLCGLFPSLRACPPKRSSMSPPKPVPAAKKTAPKPRASAPARPAPPPAEPTPAPVVDNAAGCLARVSRNGSTVELVGGTGEVVAMLRALGWAGDGR